MRLVCAANLRDGKEIRMLCGRQRYMVTSGKKGALIRRLPSSAKGNDPGKGQKWRHCVWIGGTVSSSEAILRRPPV